MGVRIAGFPCILQIIGEPSSKMMTEMSETEKKRVAEQIATLGEEGLKSKRQRLEKATDDNEVHCSYVEMFFSYSFSGSESYDMFLWTSLDVKSFPTTAYEPICCTKIPSLQSNSKQTVPLSFCTKRRIVNSRLRNSSLRTSCPISFRVRLSRDFPKWSEPVMSHSHM